MVKTRLSSMDDDATVLIVVLLLCCCVVSSMGGVLAWLLLSDNGDFLSSSSFSSSSGSGRVIPVTSILKKNAAPWYSSGVKASDWDVDGDVLKVKIKKGKHGGQSGGAFDANPNKVFPTDSITFSYDVFFGDDFDFVRGGKLPGVCLSSSKSGCATGGDWKADAGSIRPMWRADNGKDPFIIGYVYFPNKKGPKHASTQTALVNGARAREECETIVRRVSDMLGCNDVPTVECHLMNMQYRVPYTVRLEDLAKMQIPGVAMEFRRDKPHMLTALIKDHAKMTKVLVYRTGKMCIHARDPVHPMREGQRILDMLKPHIHRAAGLPITLKTESS